MTTMTPLSLARTITVTLLAFSLFALSACDNKTVSRELPAPTPTQEETVLAQETTPREEAVSTQKETTSDNNTVSQELAAPTPTQEETVLAQETIPREETASAQKETTSAKETAPVQEAVSTMETVSVQQLTPEARQTLVLIYKNGPFPYDRDGIIFGNREKLLPLHPHGYYREYTVPTPGAKNRGARRIVCGGEKPSAPDRCYYTADHYLSFLLIIDEAAKSDEAAKP